MIHIIIYLGNGCDTCQSPTTIDFTVPIGSHVGVLLKDLKGIIWKRLSNFHDISWMKPTPTIIATEGDPFSVGATRILSSGHIETVIERDDKNMLIRYDYTRFKEFEAILKINEDEIFFKVQGLPEGLLLAVKSVVAPGLSRVIKNSIIAGKYTV